MAFYLKNKDGKMWKVAGGGGITEIPIATENILGGIKSSTNKGYISVDEITALATVNDNVIMEGSGEIVLEGDFGEGPYIITIDKNPPPSSGIGYDNSKSGIDAHTVQDVIDVNAESIKELQTKNISQDTEISELDTKVSTNTESISTLTEKTTTNSNNITVVQNRIQYYSNRNLLDNWYFIDPINQRGQTSYSPTVYFDRWKGDGNCTISSTGISFTSNFYQVLEAERAKYLLGKIITLSVLLGNNIFYSTTMKVPDEIPSSTQTYMGANGLGIAIYSNNGNMQIFRSGPKDNVMAVKLELGSQQTLAHQDSDGNWILNDAPPNYQQELAKCQKYYFDAGYLTGMTGVTSAGGAYFTALIPTPVTMRANPSLNVSNITARYNGNDYTGTIVNSTGIVLGGGIRITVNLPSSTTISRQVIGYFTDEKGIQFSAEI